MAFTEVFFCDVCGKEKSEGATDWWLAWNERISPTPADPEQVVLKITRWNGFLSHDADAKHVCGARCAQTIMNRWMTAKD